MEQMNKDIQDLKISVGVHDERLHKIDQDIERLSNENKAIYEINTNVRLLAEHMTDMTNDVKEVKDDIKIVKSDYDNLGEKVDAEISSVKTEVSDLRNQPNKAKADWYDKILYLIIGGVVSAIVTTIISQIVK